MGLFQQPIRICTSTSRLFNLPRVFSLILMIFSVSKGTMKPVKGGHWEHSKCGVLSFAFRKIQSPPFLVHIWALVHVKMQASIRRISALFLTEKARPLTNAINRNAQNLANDVRYEWRDHGCDIYILMGAKSAWEPEPGINEPTEVKRLIRFVRLLKGTFCSRLMDYAHNAPAENVRFPTRFYFCARALGSHQHWADSERKDSNQSFKYFR